MEMNLFIAYIGIAIMVGLDLLFSFINQIIPYL